MGRSDEGVILNRSGGRPGLPSNPGVTHESAPIEILEAYALPGLLSPDNGRLMLYFWPTTSPTMVVPTPPFSFRSRAPLPLRFPRASVCSAMKVPGAVERPAVDIVYRVIIGVRPAIARFLAGCPDFKAY